MKVRIRIDDQIQEDEITIKCRELTPAIRRIQELAAEASDGLNLTFYKDATAYYLPIHSILFFETVPNGVEAHTADDIFRIKNRLYELEKLLPGNFIRISKSAILNIDHIYSIDKGLTSSGLIRFYHTHKHAYVSRNYYKALKLKMKERPTIKSQEFF